MNEFDNYSASQKLFIILDKVNLLLEKDEEFREIMDDSLKKNIKFLNDNLNQIKSELPDEMIDEIIEPFIPALNMIFSDLSRYFTDLNNDDSSLEGIDKQLKSRDLTIDEINELLDKRIQLK